MSVLEKRTDFSDYKFRAHAMNKLVTGAFTGLTDNQKKEFDELWPRSQGVGRKLTEKQIIKLGELTAKKNAIPSLSQTSISYLEEIFNEEFHGRKKTWQNKYTEKGIVVEEKSLTLYSNFLKEYRGLKKPLIKNKNRIENKWVTGEPDFIEFFVGDIKSSWDLDTFPQFDVKLINKDNIHQMKVYLWLTGKKKGRVVYCLVDTPEHLIIDEKFKMARKLGVMDLPVEVEEEIEWRFNFKDLTLKERVREFEVVLEEKDIELYKQQIKLAREYLNDLVKNYEANQNTVLPAA